MRKAFCAKYADRIKKHYTKYAKLHESIVCAHAQTRLINVCDACAKYNGAQYNVKLLAFVLSIK